MSRGAEQGAEQSAEGRGLRAESGERIEQRAEYTAHLTRHEREMMSSPWVRGRAG